MDSNSTIHSASLFFTCADLSTAAPIACPPLSTMLGLMFHIFLPLHSTWVCTPFCLQFRVRTYKTLPSKDFPGQNNAQQGPCMHVYPLGLLNLAFNFFVNICFHHMCLMSVLLTLIFIWDLLILLSMKWQLSVSQRQFHQTTGAYPLWGMTSSAGMGQLSLSPTLSSSWETISLLPLTVSTTHNSL